MKLTLGCDPEVCLYDTTKKAYVSAHDLIPGTKEKPHKIEGGAVQVDGTALEFNIDPATSGNEFSDHVDGVLKQAQKMLPPGIEIKFDPVVDYPKEYFAKLPKKVLTLGCDPDFNANTGAMNPVPRRQGTRCTFGGHIHIGWGNGYVWNDLNHIWDCRQIVKRVDHYFRYFMPFWDMDSRRLGMYGEMGAFRPKSFGVEYRSPSNAWLRHKELWPWMFDSINAIFLHAMLSKPYQQRHRNSPGGIHYVNYNGEMQSFKTRLNQANTAVQAIFEGVELPKFPLKDQMDKVTKNSREMREMELDDDFDEDF